MKSETGLTLVDHPGLQMPGVNDIQ